MRLRKLSAAVLLALVALLSTRAWAEMPECRNVFNASITANTNTTAFEPRSPSGILRVSISALGASQTVNPQIQMLFPTSSLWRTVDSLAAPLSANGDYLIAVGMNGQGSTQLSDTYAPFGSTSVRISFAVFNANNATIIADWCPVKPGA